MRSITTDSGEVCAPRTPPHAGSPAFVAGMGHRMAAAALRPRQASSRLGTAPPLEAAAGRVELPLRRLPDPDLRLHVAPNSIPDAPQHPDLGMICQIVAFCAVAATGAALLYWQKSGGRVEDREIGRVLQATQQARARTSLLRAEWAQLNEPERLQDLADRTLDLRPIAPEQFVAPAQLNAWLQAPASIPPAPPPDPTLDPAAEPGIQAPPGPPPAASRPPPRPRLVALALPAPPLLPALPLPVPPHPRPQRPAPVMLAALPEPSPPPPPGRMAVPSRYELPRWLTQAPLRRPTVPAMSEPPHALALPAAAQPSAPRPVAVPADPWPAPPRSFAVVAASPGISPYDGRVIGWEPRQPFAPWPYAAAPPPYGWTPAY